MADLLAMSSAIIDGAESAAQVGPINRINHQLSELRPGVAMVEAFSHSILFETDDGLVAFDTSNPPGGSRVVEQIRRWKKDRFNTIVYTHGHVDHVGGCGAFMADAASANHPRPCVCGHANVARRFERYALTNGYNHIVNERQFGQFRRAGYDISGETQFLPESSPKPERTYLDTMSMDVGGLAIELHHAKGETDDHSWAWIDKHKAICAGDFFIWNFPNAGNPQKVQRYPREWAAALRDMASRDADLFLPAHGLPIGGRARIKSVLTDVADTLDKLVDETIALMNQGARLNDIIHSVKVDPAALEKPYLRPLYDEPEFVVRNIWRLYGGWYDGNPANLKPAQEAMLGAEIASLAGGAVKLAERARALAQTEVRVACHLAELAALAAPDDKRVHELRAEVFQLRRDGETSLMAKGIFGSAANESKSKSV
ncbi:alkyl sulfatase dimerization domain-containing protein [Candidatus Viadribacter manganicus]|uniref:MBL fold metallo-hydrolase n=1 Tax=Candidatus Viadribacter manganicus TaxID=1759059 RepID=A0A1B1AGL3_9PROT|nr:alkyl sulfatase dimerization domain-containing protein [Candidatus Viadribacter manganicus]ANP45694.1 MBL fold metallo-hydrolase [Candidatus Viadribacter manganicus]